MRSGASRVLGLLAFGALLTGCAEVNSAVDQAENVRDRASACSKALGIVDLRPDPQRAAEQAGRKAKELRQLAESAANVEVQKTLFTLADSYVELEQRKADHMADFTDWLRQNTKNVQRLQQACM